MHDSNLALATTGDSTGGEHLMPLLLAFLVPKFPLPLLLLYAFSRIRASDGGPDIGPLEAPASWNPRDEARHKQHQAQRANHEARAAAHKVVMNENAQASPQPWPQAVPKNLPPFPAGWEFAEPPSKAVQTRAWQLLEPLWAQGAGHTATELTEGNWITYRAEIVSNGKRGVVAYRVRAGARPAPTPAATPAPAAPLPPVARVPATPTMPARPVLRQGSGMGALVADAPWVVYLQKALAITPADGKFGAHTADLVGAFQVRHGLTLDRVVGPLTWAAVDTAAPNIAHDHA